MSHELKICKINQPPFFAKTFSAESILTFQKLLAPIERSNRIDHTEHHPVETPHTLFPLAKKNWKLLDKIITGKTLEASLPSTEFEHQALLINVPKDHKTVSNECKAIFLSQISLSDLLHKSTPVIEVQSSLYGSSASSNGEKETPEASKSALSTVENDLETPQEKETFQPDFSKSL